MQIAPLKLIVRIITQLLLIHAVIFCHAQSTSIPNNQLYLGQPRPGQSAVIFAPGLVSTDVYEHSPPAFSPTGDRVLWTIISDRSKPARILEMYWAKDGWSRPASPSFADTTADDFYPSYSPDGNWLFFSTRRKMPDGFSPHDGICLWVVERMAEGWGSPKPFSPLLSMEEVYAHSITSNGNLYFSFRRDNGRIFDIAYLKNMQNDQQPIIFPQPLNSPVTDDGPFVAPDESYLLFESSRPGGIERSVDIYICFRRKDGTFGSPINMGETVNSKFTERFPYVSPDGKYLFFGSDRRQDPNAFGTDTYWMDASIIEKLRKLHEEG